MPYHIHAIAALFNTAALVPRDFVMTMFMLGTSTAVLVSGEGMHNRPQRVSGEGMHNRPQRVAGEGMHNRPQRGRKTPIDSRTQPATKQDAHRLSNGCL
jgi:hypothetical protein